MRFDEFWTDDDGRAAETPAELPPAPDGRHAGEITKAQMKDLKFKIADGNPHGTSLVVEIEVPKYQPVEAIIPAHFRGLIQAVCVCAGVAPPARGEDWDEGQLVGRQVVVELVNGVGKTGRPYVRVDKWHHGPAPLPAEVTKRAPARSQAAKAHKEACLDADDIPF